VIDVVPVVAVVAVVALRPPIVIRPVIATWTAVIPKIT
jgi:hypothetical protein